MDGTEKRKAYENFFRLNYNRTMNFIPYAYNITNKNLKIAANALKVYGIWFDEYVNTLSKLENGARSDNSSKETSKIATPFDMESVKGSSKSYRMTVNGATKLIVDKYLNCIYNVQACGVKEKNKLGMIKRKVMKDFKKGKFFTFNIIARLYEDIHKII